MYDHEFKFNCNVFQALLNKKTNCICRRNIYFYNTHMEKKKSQENLSSKRRKKYLHLKLI